MDDFDQFFADLKAELSGPGPASADPAPDRQRPGPSAPQAAHRTPGTERSAPRPATPERRAPTREELATLFESEPPEEDDRRHLYDYWWIFAIAAAVVVIGAVLVMWMLVGRDAQPAAARAPQTVTDYAAPRAEEPEEPADAIEETPAVSADTAETEAATHISTSANGDVTLNVPADVAAEVTQEELDELVTERGYRSAVLEEDGSVTYVMTAEQHRQMLLELQDTLDDTLFGLLTAEDRPHLISIAPNEDYTNFRITVSGSELTPAESGSMADFYSIGTTYNAYAGDPEADIHVVFVDQSGDIVAEGDSLAPDRYDLP